VRIAVRAPLSASQKKWDSSGYFAPFRCFVGSDVVILNQLQPLHAGMPVLADDDVIVHGDAMSMIAFVIRISACDSVGSPEG